jgi:hypothetical protein
MSTNTVDLGNGFYDHGVATPISNHRGIVATVDGEGRNIALVWLFDHSGCYALLLLDAETGRSEEYEVPFPPGRDCPFASILSSKNRFYTHFNSHFCEFDPAKREFTFFSKTANQMSMGMTEDDAGLIWSVTYPNSGVVSYNPESGEFKDYGHVHKENWPQYQRSVAADDTGWIYFSIGNTASGIIAFDPESGTGTQLIPESERGTGTADAYRDLNGKVYGRALSEGDDWYELYQGKGTKISKPSERNEKPIITSSQGLFYQDFPDGSRLNVCDTVNKIIEVEDPRTGEVTRNKFDYSSDGAHLMGVAAAPGGTICGGTAFPMRFFSYDPIKDTWFNEDGYCQANTVVRQGEMFYEGGYVAGYLLEWDPTQTWVKTEKDNPDSNPRFLADCKPDIYRPHDLLAHSDGKTIVLSGTPDYGYTGGGLFFWDRETETGVLLKNTDLITDLSVMSMAELPERKLLCGTTTSPGTGGERKAEVSELFIIDMETKQIDWHEVVYDDAEEYTDLCKGPNGLIFGILNRRRFFVFDPALRKVIHEEFTMDTFGKTNYQQGPRVFVLGPTGEVFILFEKGIAQIDLSTFEISLITDSPVPIGPGGDYLDGSIYFSSGSHLYSYKLS